ncbi:MAG: hypothetical protein IPL70_06670 [Uliginosibacterium sp.]|nr:hypothetical protein [Uliginosibacterium sp.]
MGSIVKDMQRNKAGLYTAEDGETIAKSGAALDFYAQEMDKIFRQTDERAYNPDALCGTQRGRSTGCHTRRKSD